MLQAIPITRKWCFGFIWAAVALSYLALSACKTIELASGEPYRNCFYDWFMVGPGTGPVGKKLIFEIPYGGRITHRTGLLHLPADRRGPVPVVIMVPGTGHIGQRQEFHRTHLLRAGIGTFVIDIKCGVFTGVRDRPRYSVYLPVGYAALRLLRRQPGVDPRRIAVMGWSFGAAIGVHLGLSENFPIGEQRFAAHIAFYGGCRRVDILARENVPVLLLAGMKDNYRSAIPCKELRDDPPYLLVKFYPEAHHGFDNENVCKHREQRTMCWHKESAMHARREMISFLTNALRLGTDAK